ncbi:MAG: hypothetical protein LBS81_02110 [Endomicrobium sp.]|jgi:hypothetical protein|nr:hypothetical protein [Endomicrobium sp.]
MRKIKNFKVNLRLREILRSVKKLINTVGLPVNFEEEVQRCCFFYSKFLVPSVIYEIFSKETLHFKHDEDVPSKWIAASIFFLTIGNNLYEEYSKNTKTFGEYTGQIVSAVVADALQQAKNFVQRLISNEAEKENCEILRIVNVPQDLYSVIGEDIPINKINISIEAGELMPRYSLCGLFYWIPSKKKIKK